MLSILRNNNTSFIKLLIHLLFWGLFVSMSLVFVSEDKHWYQHSFLEYLLVVAGITYLNDLLLFPFFIKKKAYFIYGIVVLALSFLATIVYCNIISTCNCNLEFCLSKYMWQTIFPLVFLSFSALLLRVLDKQKELERSKSEHLTSELKFLRSQLNPHILFNNLNTIYSYSLENPDEVPEMILNLSNSLKYVLLESEHQEVDLNKDLAYLDNFMNFMTIRSEGTKTVTYHKTIDDDQYKIAPLLLISIIENAFKHSSKKEGIPEINVTLKIENNTLALHCSNDFDPKKTHQFSNGIGLNNLKKRLKLSYSNRHTLSEDQKNGKYIVELKIQLS